MFVIVQHKISDPKTFWSAAEKVVPALPKGLRVVQTLPNQEGTQAVCLWEADNVDAVRKAIESSVGQVDRARTSTSRWTTRKRWASSASRRWSERESGVRAGTPRRVTASMSSPVRSGYAARRSSTSDKCARLPSWPTTSSRRSQGGPPRLGMSRSSSSRFVQDDTVRGVTRRRRAVSGNDQARAARSSRIASRSVGG